MRQVRLSASGIRHALLSALAIALVGCGGHGSRSTAPQPQVLAIANLAVTLQGPCVLPGPTPATVEVLTFSYTDSDGNLAGGTVQNTTIASAGGPFNLTAPIPSNPVSITGTTSGTVTIVACLHFGSNASVTEQVSVTDAAGNQSNQLSLVVNRPAGAPEVPRGSRELRKAPRG